MFLIFHFTYSREFTSLIVASSVSTSQTRPSGVRTDNPPAHLDCRIHDSVQHHRDPISHERIARTRHSCLATDDE